MKNINRFYFSLLYCVILIGCKEEPLPLPVILSVSPDSGYEGDLITISGSNFSGSTEVRLGTVWAPVVSVSETKIVVRVPGFATTGIINVSSKERTVEGPQFVVYTKPYFSTFVTSHIEPKQAIIQLQVTDIGSAAVTSYGIIYSTSEIKTDKDGAKVIGGTEIPLGRFPNSSGQFNVYVDELTKKTEYHVRGFISTKDKTFLSAEVKFTTTNTNEWIRIEGPSKDLSISLPERGYFPIHGNKAYLFASTFSAGTQTQESGIFQYDPVHNVLNALPDCPGPKRERPVRFIIDNKLYVGLGYIKNNFTEKLHDFWEFDLTARTWKQLRDFNGDGFLNTTIENTTPAVVAGGRAYVGLKTLSSNALLWEYVPQLDVWLQHFVTDLSGLNIQIVYMAANINGKIYFLLLRSGSKLEIWEYDPTPNANVWTKKKEITDQTFSFHGVFTTAGGKAYVFDSLVNTWQFDPIDNTWLKVTSPEVWPYFAATIDGKMYVGSSSLNDVYVFVPE